MKLCPQVTLPHCEMDGAFLSPESCHSAEAIPSSAAAAASSLSNRDSGRLGECEDDFGEGEEEEEEEEAGQGGNHGGGRGRLQQGGGGAAGGNARRRNKVRGEKEGWMV